MKSYDDPAKQLSRDKEDCFIATHLKTELYSPQNIKVMCLESPELLEVKNVFDKHKIPRENITVVEKDPEVARLIRERGEGINVFNCWDYEFFANTQEKFDIISLDYKGKKNRTIIQSIRLISNRRILRNKGILIVNTFSAREKNEEKDFLIPVSTIINSSTVDSTINRSNNKLNLENEVIEKSTAEFNSIFENIASLQESRDFYSEIIMSALCNSDSINFSHLYPWAEDTKELIEQKICVMNLPKEDYKDTARAILSRNLYQREMIHYIGTFFDLNDDPKVAESVYVGLKSIFNEIYTVRNIERYKYISSNGAPMEFDLFYAENVENLFARIKSYFYLQKASAGGYILRLKIHKLRGKPRKALELMSDIIKANIQFMWPRMPERIFLGSSVKNGKEDVEMAKQKKDDKQTQGVSILESVKPGDTITKDQAIKLLESGWSAKQIAKIFKGFTKMQIAAFKAHVTMGTYT
jgi:hypothetical protein